MAEVETQFISPNMDFYTYVLEHWCKNEGIWM